MAGQEIKREARVYMNDKSVWRFCRLHISFSSFPLTPAYSVQDIQEGLYQHCQRVRACISIAKCIGCQIDCV